MNEIFIAAGGDRRLSAAASFFEEKGCTVERVLGCGFDDIGNVIPADYLILPMPVTIDGVNLSAPDSEKAFPLAGLSSLVKKGGIVFGGRISPDIRRIFEDQTVIDYAAVEGLAVNNAMITAEGAVSEAMRRQDITLYGQKILVIGFGRIGRALVRVLSGFSADITVAVRRRESGAWVGISGCRSIMSECLNADGMPYTLVFNTAPSEQGRYILDRSILERMGKDALIIDLASAPGSTDLSAAAELGIEAVNLTGVPGRYAPETAGRLIADTVCEIINTRKEVDKGDFV